VTGGANDVPLALRAVLFDMDGTLVDTEPYWIEAEYALVEAFGGTWTDAHAHALVGNALLTSAEYIREHGNVDLDPPEIVERMLDHVVLAAEAHLPWRPGALALLAEVRARGVACGLVTMSYTRLADAVVAGLPPGTFSTVVTGDQVLDGKPHPEAYLTAAVRLGAPPDRCVAIEDSPTGIASAEAAGCVVVAIPHAVPIDPADSRVIVESLTELSVDTLDALVRARLLR
jgi:HAD superfamily hydrolase (TIGR01509 family)